jgi:uncharacterized protein YndB with AHSA1/START domain
MEFKFQVQLKILKPVEEVFEAVINPKKLSGYFTKTATRMEEGGTAIWSFQEVSGEYPVAIRKIIPNRLIVLEWETTEGGYNTTVEMEFQPLEARSTMVKIKESGWKQTEKGLTSSYGNCMGWTHMLCCLKAFVEHGINLREGGAF